MKRPPRPRPWTAIDDEMVVRHELRDKDIAEVIDRTVPAIRTRRMELTRPGRNTMTTSRWAAEHPDRVKENHAQWRKAHPDRLRQMAREYYAASSAPPEKRHGHYRKWMPEEDAELMSFKGPLRVLANQFGRTYGSVLMRRSVLRKRKDVPNGDPQ